MPELLVYSKSYTGTGPSHSRRYVRSLWRKSEGSSTYCEVRRRKLMDPVAITWLVADVFYPLSTINLDRKALMYEWILSCRRRIYCWMPRWISRSRISGSVTSLRRVVNWTRFVAVLPTPRQNSSKVRLPPSELPVLASGLPHSRFDRPLAPSASPLLPLGC